MMNEEMKFGVSIIVSKQIGYETWQDSCVTKVFDQDATLREIMRWVQSINIGDNIATVKFSQIEP